MSTKPDTAEVERTETVQDDGSVDQRVKNRILDARARVDEREDLLFVQAPANPEVQITYEEQLLAWSTSVRQYLRAILPLLKSDKIDAAEEYYENIEIASREVPPPNTEQYPFAQFAREDIPNNALKNELGLPPTFDPPEPKTVQFHGLVSILNRDKIEQRWSVVLNPDELPPEQTVIPLSQSYPIPKDVLESAVEHADAFLQQAGIGLEIGSGRPYTEV